ncbi:MAG: dihydroneopterin aldolase [Pseudomonadales bacterium]|jgi:dihydroneopterin aldolase|nr:dihydroneopterin aldolase [Pseudomonadales bacterium]
MDIIYIRELEVKTVIGVYEWEREIKQPVTVDLDMAHDIRAAAATDDVAYVLDYKRVSMRVSDYIEQSRFTLLETLAEAVATLVLREFGVPWVRVKVGKPAALTGARAVGIIIERGSLTSALTPSLTLKAP